MIERGRLYRLHREVVRPGAPAGELETITDVRLERWVDERIELYFAAWTLSGEVHEGAARVVRPQLHRCGEAPRWLF